MPPALPERFFVIDSQYLQTATLPSKPLDLRCANAIYRRHQCVCIGFPVRGIARSVQQKVAEHSFSKLLFYKDLTLRIGDISISIEGAREKIAFELTPSYRSFIRPGKADIRLHLHRGLPETPLGQKVFECPPIWRLYRQKDKSMIEIFHHLSDLETVFKGSNPVNVAGVEPF